MDQRLEVVELLQDGGWLGAGGYAARKVIDDPGREAGLVCLRRRWRREEETRVILVIMQSYLSLVGQVAGFISLLRKQASIHAGQEIRCHALRQSTTA